MLHKRQSFGTRKVSPPQPTCMTEDQKATYLKDLRTNRPARPVGSRPLPSKPTISKLQNLHNETLASKSPVGRLAEGETISNNKRHSLPAIVSLDASKGRPLVQAPNHGPAMRKVTPPDMKYRGSSARELEKKEAHLLRQALEERDFEHDEGRVYQAAQLEAADLVWKHRNPELADQEILAPYRNPDIPKKVYKILEDGSALDNAVSSRGPPVSEYSPHMVGGDLVPLRIKKRAVPERVEAGPLSGEPSNRRRSSGARKVSGRSLFRNPSDQIFEEQTHGEQRPNGHHVTDTPLQSTSHNPQLRHSRPLPEKPHIMKAPSTANVSESRHATYTAAPISETNVRPLPSIRSPSPEAPGHQPLPAVEIRSEEIRAATRMRRSDRSPHLPTPTAVSDRPGRPIVSFDPAWRAGNGTRNDLEAERSTTRSLPLRPTATNVDNSIPTITPAEDESLPVIQISTDYESKQSSPPVVSGNRLLQKASNSALDTPRISINDHSHGSRPVPLIQIEAEENVNINPSRKSHTGRTSTNALADSGKPDRRVPWLSRGPTVPTISGTRVSTVTCTACGRPISDGRIVTASGAASGQKARFHPNCFTCFHCKERLECVSFYPEPEAARVERLGMNEGSDELPVSHTEQPFLDISFDLRFYCHLDYHDLYSPRCASCHTPIEGAVILAAGKSWHEGHFFCAECGDPFSSSSPFVESKGYAYCVGCHTKRTSARCRACKKQILDDISVEALGGKWHEECFKCDECQGDFGDEGRFFVREVEFELTEKEQRRGMMRGKVEERAVCDGCEQRRLKSRDVAAFI